MEGGLGSGDGLGSVEKDMCGVSEKLKMCGGLGFFSFCPPHDLKWT